MTRTTSDTNFTLSTSNNSLDWENQRMQWTRDVIRLMAIVILVSAGSIFAGNLAGFFTWTDTFPIYVMLLLILPVWWGSRRNRWKWVSYFPSALCFFLAVYVTSQSGFITVFVLIYALAVLLAGILLNNRMGYLVTAASILFYVGFGLRVQGSLLTHLPAIITLSFGLIGISVLQGYIQSRLRSYFEARNVGAVLLKEEISHRRQIEQVQQDQEAQLRRLAEFTTDLIAEIDEHGTFQYVSPSYRASLGFDPETLLGTNAFNLVHPDDLEATTEAARKAAADQAPRRIKARIHHADGSFIYYEISGNPMVDDHGDHRGFILASRDISAEKQNELALQDSEKKFRNIIESLPLGMHMYALEDDDSLILTGSNPAADQILGVDHLLLHGMTIEAAFPLLKDTEIPDKYREIARIGGLWKNERFDYAQYPILGAYEVHAYQTTPGKMVAVFTDITGRIRADEALRSSEEKFSTAFVTSPDSVNINRLTDGVYIDINQGFTRLMGYSREEVIGKSSLDLNIWADSADRARLVSGLQEKGEVENLEARFRRKNGAIGIGLMSAKVIVIDNEKCILSITRDITKRIQSEIELRDTHARLEQAYDATLKGWARALDLRERETGDHSRRVVDSTLMIARRLGIHGADLLHIEWGALLHDIGKMGIPDNILLKPGQLTADEWSTMRKHADLAKSMLKDIDYLQSSIDIPYYHHERWDGSGYPNGLKAESIPLSARIFAVVDVYDALTHDRPYRPAWSASEARHYLREQSGIQFDPEIVNLFFEIIQPGSL